MTAQSQAAHYYARKRRRSHVDTPRLFRTHFVPIGGNIPQGLIERDVTRPITFKTKLDLSFDTGFPHVLFSMEPGIVIQRPVNNVLQILVRGQAIADVNTPSSGQWTLIFSILPGNRQTATWNQYNAVAETPTLELVNDRFADPDVPLQVLDNRGLIEGLSIYAGQLPRHFYGVNSDPGVIPEDGLFVLIVDPNIEVDQDTLNALGVFDG